MTFKVPSTRAACDRARALGLNPVGFDDSDPGWIEAFLHPKESLGIVVQFAESRGVETEAERPQQPPPGVPDPPLPVTLLGLAPPRRIAASAPIGSGRRFSREWRRRAVPMR